MTKRQRKQFFDENVGAFYIFLEMEFPSLARPEEDWKVKGVDPIRRATLRNAWRSYFLIRHGRKKADTLLDAETRYWGMRYEQWLGTLLRRR